MNIYLQLILVSLSLVFFAMVILFVKKNKLDVAHSLVWFVLTIMYIVIACFPQIATALAGALNIVEPVNAVFLLNIAFLTGATFIIYVNTSKSNERIRLLIQEVSLLKHKLTEKEKNK